MGEWNGRDREEDRENNSMISHLFIIMSSNFLCQKWNLNQQEQVAESLAQNSQWRKSILLDDIILIETKHFSNYPADF